MSTVKKMGTGSLKQDPSVSRKWMSGVKSQLEQTGVSVNTRMVPIATITPDPKNPRELEITAEEVHATAIRHPIPQEWLNNRSPSNAHNWDDYSTTIHSELRAQKAEEFLKLALLAMSIGEPEGLINPVTTYVGNSGTDLRLIAGERRFLAHVLLRLDTIATHILANAPSAYEIDVLQWHENNQREDLSLSESIYSIERLCESYQAQTNEKVSVRKLVVIAGVRQTIANRYLTIIKASTKQEIMSLIKEGKISSLSKAAVVAGYSKAELKAFLNPERPVRKSASRFKIHASVPLSPLQALITQSVHTIGDTTLIDDITRNPPATVDECATVFERLLVSIEAQQQLDES